MWEHEWTPEQRAKLEEWLACIRRNGGNIPKIQAPPYAEDGSYPNKAQVDEFINKLEAQLKR